MLIIKDIGANFPDAVFRGLYNGKKCHVDDFESMLKRCSQVQLSCIMSTSATLKDYQENCEIIEKYKCEELSEFPKILTTLGVHPTYCAGVLKKCQNDWKRVDEYFEKMKLIFESEPKNLVAIGECGLDYARLFCSPKEVQIDFFQRHFDLLKQLNPAKRPPMFLHMRDCSSDFMEIMKKNRDLFVGGVVHSFTGTVEDVKELLAFSDNLYIGINGCSLRNELGIEVAGMVPLDRIMIESDAPYCEMRPSHASSKYLSDFEWPILQSKDKSKHSCENPVKGRNEPSETRRVLRVLSKIRGVDEEELAEIIYQNTCKLFQKCK